MSSSFISHDTNIFKSKMPANKVEETTLITDKGLSLKKGIKASKTDKQEANYVITGYELIGLDITCMCDIIVYDIPVAWMIQYFLQKLAF